MLALYYVVHMKCVLTNVQTEPLEFSIHNQLLFFVFLDASSPLCFMQLGRVGGGGRYVKTQLSMYRIYYADDDMYRPLWDIFR